MPSAGAPFAIVGVTLGGKRLTQDPAGAERLSRHLAQNGFAMLRYEVEPNKQGHAAKSSSSSLAASTSAATLAAATAGPATKKSQTGL